MSSKLGLGKSHLGVPRSLGELDPAVSLGVMVSIRSEAHVVRAPGEGIAGQVFEWACSHQKQTLQGRSIIAAWLQHAQLCERKEEFWTFAIRCLWPHSWRDHESATAPS
eukprot:366268-Chlamydomonas_euryale.AAC.16